EELRSWIPDAQLQRQEGDVLFVSVPGGDNEPDTKTELVVVRTGPIVDGITGYQGPSELLLKLSRPVEAQNESLGDWIIDDIRLRSSFDNEPYVGYCKQEYGFWPIFENQTVSELASMDLQAAGVEGVSGATMTSMAVAETLVTSSRKLLQRREAYLRNEAIANRPWWSLQNINLHYTAADLGCFTLLVLFPLARRLRWFRKTNGRRLWLVFVVVVVGLWSGNLLSLALLGGWGTSGIAWTLAPALAAIAFLAFSLPPLGKSNFYCSHLCPHGALQQLVRPKPSRRRTLRIGRRLTVCLTSLPGFLLTVAYVLLALKPKTDVSSWEPFHAYLFRIAPWFSIAFALATVAISAYFPMAYCRMGCPTGRLLDYLRRNASSHQIKWADVVAVSLLVFVVAVRLFAQKETPV
ncbi:MAG: 4Fe-4S binding protein, partial [Planctomycetota bacterium]